MGAGRTELARLLFCLTPADSGTITLHDQPLALRSPQNAVAIAAQAGGKKLDAKELRTAAESPAVRGRVEASTKEFFAHQISQRPAFVLESAISDKAVFSGVVKIEPLAATIDAMLADTAAYAAHKAHFGGPPAG